MGSERTDEEERKARAARLREEINCITKKSPDDEKADQLARPKEAESPREFIHRRMRELDDKAK